MWKISTGSLVSQGPDPVVPSAGRRNNGHKGKANVSFLSKHSEAVCHWLCKYLNTQISIHIGQSCGFTLRHVLTNGLLLLPLLCVHIRVLIVQKSRAS